MGISRSVSGSFTDFRCSRSARGSSGLIATAVSPEHRLRPRSRDHDHFITAHDRVADVPQAALGFLVLHFQIGKRGLAARAPVDDVIAPINQTLFVQPDERLAHGARKSGVQREMFARPVAAHARALHLFDDAPAVLLLPLPHALFEFLASQVALGEPFLGDLPLHHDLRGDARVIRSRQPQRVDGFAVRCPLHPAPANLRVDDGMLEHVAHVERPGHVRRRNRERKIGLAGLALAFGTRKVCCSTHHSAQCGSNRWGS